MMDENLFFEHFCVLKDFRQENKIHHKLIDIIFITVAAFIADCNTWTEVAIFAIDIYETLEKGHGRIEKRYYYIISHIEWCSWKTE
ncbi:MAG: transposase family protein [Proteobacteria bacterium]|nr:transposase family protein [Pseudomonadota bacterium]